MVYDILPEKDLHFSDIRDSLNANGGVVNNDVASAFKTAANINPWSKHKPLILRVDFCQDIDPNKPNYNAYWWKGVDGWCGFNPNRLSSYSSVSENMDGNLNGWLYLLPQGGTNSPYRIGDFAKYKTDATPIVREYTVPDTAFANNPSGTFRCSFPISISIEDNYNLSLADFDTLKSAYFGIYCKKEGTVYSVRATSENTISNGGSIVEINPFNMPAGEWTVYPFISTIKLVQDEADGVGSYYTIPNLQEKKIQILTTDLIISISAKIFKSPLRIEYEISVSNLSQTAKELKVNTLFVKYSRNDIDDPLETNEIEETLKSPISVSGNFQGVVDSGTVSLKDVNMYPSGCKVWVTLNSGQYVKGISPAIGDLEIP